MSISFYYCNKKDTYSNIYQDFFFLARSHKNPNTFHNFGSWKVFGLTLCGCVTYPPKSVILPSWAYIKSQKSVFKKLTYISGESMDPTAMICMLDYKDVDGEERPVLLAFKHGLEEEKC